MLKTSKHTRFKIVNNIISNAFLSFCVSKSILISNMPQMHVPKRVYLRSHIVYAPAEEVLKLENSIMEQRRLRAAK